MKTQTLPCVPWSVATAPSGVGWLTTLAPPAAPPVVYGVGLDALDAEPLGAWLTAEELARAGRFRLAADRRRFTVGRGVLRHLLGQQLKRTPLGLEFFLGPQGKPYLATAGQSRAPADPAPRAFAQAAGSGLAGPFFNVSHSGDWVLIALHASREVGVDVEQIRRGEDWEAVAARVFPVHEVARLRAVPPVGRDDAFFAARTRHEARLKALGGGLGMAVTGEWNEAAPAAESAGCEVATLAVPPGYAGACAWASCAEWRRRC